MSDPRLRVGPWVAYTAALWASVFAVFHIIWAAGRYPLLDAELARAAFATPWKWAYDVMIAAMCVIAVPVALAPVMSWGRHVPRRLILILAWAARHSSYSGRWPAWPKQVIWSPWVGSVSR